MADKRIYGINVNRDSIYVLKITKKGHYDITISEESYEKNENLILKGFRIKIASYEKKII